MRDRLISSVAYRLTAYSTTGLPYFRMRERLSVLIEMGVIFQDDLNSISADHVAQLWASIDTCGTER